MTNLARPNGNITGFSNFELSVFGKMLQIFKQMVPNITRVALIFNPDNATAVYLSRLFGTLAAPLAVEPTLVPVHHPEQIERAIDLFAREPNGGLVFPPDITLSIYRELVIATAARYRLPAIYSNPVMVQSGGLMYTDRIRGTFFDPARPGPHEACHFANKSSQSVRSSVTP